MKKYIVLIFTLISIFAIEICSAQVNQMEFVRNATFRPGFHIKYWDFEDGAAFDRFIEASVPVTYSMAMGSRLSVDVVTSYVGMALEPVTGKAFKYDNLTDSFVRGSLILGDNLALLTVGGTIPSGETELTGTDPILAGIAANRSLDNPVSSFGSGSNYTIGLAIARPVGAWVLGFGAGYAIRGEYDILPGDDELNFNPGDEFNLTIGLEREFDFLNDEAKFSADIIYTNYSEDELSGDFQGPAFLYQAGDKILLSGQFILPLGLFNPLILSAVNRIRLDNTTNDVLLEENGGEFEFRATGLTTMGKAFSLRTTYRAQIYGDNGKDAEGATIHGFGAGFILRLSSHFTFDPLFIYYTGTVNTGPDTDLSLTGLELTGGFTFRF